MKKYIGLLVVSLLLTACGETTVKTDDSNKTETKKESTSKIGDAKKVGDITFTLNEVKKSDDRNQFSDIEAEEVVTVFYTVKNGSDKDYVAGQEAAVYVDGKKADDYALGTDKTETLSKNHTADVSKSFAVPKNVKKIEIELAPLFSTVSEKAIYNVEVK